MLSTRHQHCLDKYLVVTALLIHAVRLQSNLQKRPLRLRQPVLSLPKQIPIQLLLCKTTTCLVRSATTFLSPKRKKNLSKTTTTQLNPLKKQETNIAESEPHPPSPPYTQGFFKNGCNGGMGDFYQKQLLEMEGSQECSWFYNEGGGKVFVHSWQRHANTLIL